MVDWSILIWAKSLDLWGMLSLLTESWMKSNHHCCEQPPSPTDLGSSQNILTRIHSVRVRRPWTCCKRKYYRKDAKDKNVRGSNQKIQESLICCNLPVQILCPQQFFEKNMNWLHSTWGHFRIQNKLGT